MTKLNQNSDALHGIKEILQIRMVSKELGGLSKELGGSPNESLKFEKSAIDLKKVLPLQLKKLNELHITTKKSEDM